MTSFTPEMACFEQLNPKAGELSDDQLENVSGGTIVKFIITDTDCDADIGDDESDNGYGGYGSNP